MVKVASWLALREAECKGYLRRRAAIVKVASWVARKEKECKGY